MLNVNNNEFMLNKQNTRKQDNTEVYYMSQKMWSDFYNDCCKN